MEREDFEGRPILDVIEVGVRVADWLFWENECRYLEFRVKAGRSA